MENLNSNLKDENSSNQIKFNNQDNFISRVKKNYGKFDLVNYLALLGLLIGICIMSFTAYDFIIYAFENEGHKIWYGMIDRLTTQSNWIAAGFFILYCFNPGLRIFNGNKFLISAMAYILFTFFGYNFILILILGDSSYSGDAFNIITNMFTHIFMPLYLIGFGLVKLWFRPDGEYKSFLSLLSTGMIYPTIYTFYTITIPFIYQMEVEPGVFETYSVYGSATNVKDNPGTSWIYISVIYFGFFPGSLALFYYYKNLVKKFKKK